MLDKDSKELAQDVNNNIIISEYSEFLRPLGTFAWHSYYGNGRREADTKLVSRQVNFFFS